MNLGRKITLYLLLCIGLCGVAFAQPVDIPDQNLEQAIRETLELPANAPLLTTHMQSLNRLAAGQRGITDLTGLEHAANLTALWLTRNEISDISPLAGLTQLEVLSVADNPLRDLAPIANLTNLWSLSIIGLPMTDLRPLAGLTRLKELFAHNCEITDIAPLANLTQLTRLHLAANRIVDITPLANLTALEKLWLESNQIVDISPLANLTGLDELRIHENTIFDFSPLAGLNLANFTRDEECDVPGFPIQDRLDNRSLPSIVLAWDDGILNRGGDWWDDSLPYYERVASHDLWWHINRFELRFRLTPQGYKILGDLPRGIARREELLSINPNMLILVDIHHSYAGLGRYPENWFGWLRDENGKPVLVDEHDPHSQIWIDFRRPEVQAVVVQRAIAVAKCGLYDGIIFDAWAENITVFPNNDLEQEREAQLSILRRIREGVPDDFLILCNNNRNKLPLSIPYINGGFMETFPRVRENGYTRDDIIEIESNLIWYEANAREPKINCLRGFGVGAEPPDSPNNRRWMRLFTTMSLTLSDGYALYTLGTIGGQKQYQKHIWYDFWDADLGQPVERTARRYQDTEGLYIREFTNGWAVYNRSGKAQTISLPQSVTVVSSGQNGITHILPDLDGEMYLKTKNPADVNRDGVVNILDLTLVAQGFGTDKPEADVNGDGFVNILDLVFVANQF